MTDPDALVQIARIVGAHGLKGEVKAAPETDDPERVRRLKQVFVGRSDQEVRPLALASVRSQSGHHGITLVLALEGVQDRDTAEALKGKRIYARASDLPALNDDEIYFHDFVGLQAETVEGNGIGIIHEVMDLPAHPVFVIKRKDAADALVPAIPEFIEQVDLEAGRIVLRLIEGLIE